ncbi:MAG: hypothetical protein WKF52_05945 [Sphingomicrobium sp.]
MTGDDSPRVFISPPLMLAAFVALGLLIDSGPKATGLAMAAAVPIGLVGLALITAALGLFFRSKTRPDHDSIETARRAAYATYASRNRNARSTN